MKKITVAIVGTGYVGLSNAILLAQHHKVFALDIVEEKVTQINAGKSPIVDREIEEYLASAPLDLTATLDPALACSNADFIVISTPTNYDEEKNYFDTSSVEDAIRTALKFNKTATIVIKSTIPIGYTQSVREKFAYDRILFSPEFLREGRALYDSLHPSRIIVGVPEKSPDLMPHAEAFAALLAEGAVKTDIPTLFTGSQEAESIKLFANTYLAMRVAFFNELDTFAELKHLNAAEIIDGVSLDPRIGMFYNNPSFGYGGYCLPKDTKQLLANYDGVPERMIDAIVDANETRKEHIAHQIYANALKNRTGEGKPVIGIYRLVMKSGSDNFRQSAIQDVMAKLHDLGADLVIYEPTLQGATFGGYAVEKDLEAFKSSSDIIIANRADTALSDVASKVYTRDLYRRD